MPNYQEYIRESYRLIRLEETESTNLFVQQNMPLFEQATEIVILSDYQSHGRGQLGNTWESEKGKNLTFSILYKPKDIPANRSFVIAELAALSVKNMLDHYISDVSVKWPNDIYWHDKKICGILIENNLMGGNVATSVIGIGININQKKFVSNAPNPISLAMITDEIFDRLVLLDKWFYEFQKLCSIFNKTIDFQYINHTYNKTLYRREGFHPYRDATGTFEAAIQTIEPSGHLILERLDGTRSRYAFKDVEFLQTPT